MTRIASPRILCFIIAILLTSVFALTLGAQTSSVRLEGITWDPSGDPIPGVILTAVEGATGRQHEALSDSEGYYRFLALPPGTYTVTAKTKNFKDVIHRGITLFPPDTITENFSFEVSAIDKEVPVGDSTRVNDSANSGAFPRREIEALPLEDRNPLSLLVFQPGIQTNGGKESESTVNGTRKGMNRLLMDGISMTDPSDLGIGSSLLSLNPDSVSNMQIVTSGAKAEYGGSGGGYFVVSSRPGAKSWSGNVYDYFGNKNMNANDFFINSAGLDRQGYTRNIFGGTISGPLKEKTLLFANFEANITNQSRHVNSMVLTEEARAGLFRWYEPYDSTQDDSTLRTFNIAANDPRGLGIDPTMAEQLAAFPDNDYLNRSVGDGLNTAGYIYETPTHVRQERIAVRVDQDVNKNHKLFFRFNWQHADTTDTRNSTQALYTGEAFPTLEDNSWAVAGGSDWTINPHMVNELRIGYIRSEIDSVRPGRLAGTMVIPNSWSNQQDTSFPGTYQSPGFDITNNFSHSISVHSLKYGGSFRRTQQKRIDYNGAYPDVTLGTGYGNDVPSSIGPSEQTEITSQGREIFEDLYNDILGRIESVNLTYNSSLNSVLPAGTARERSYASSEFSAFIQDDWKIRRNITLNLGLRFDVFTSPNEQNGFQSVLDKASQISSSSQISDFTVAGSDHWYSTDWSNFAPRAGVAWDIKGNGSLVLRGAYGMYYDRLNGAIINYVDQNSYGFSQPLNTYPNAGGTDWRLSDGIPVPSQPAPLSMQPSATRDYSVALINPNLSTPRVDQFNVTLEKRFWGAIFEVGYTGTRGKNLFQYANLNQTKTDGDFLQSFQELQEYRDMGTPVSASNTIVNIFGSPIAAFEAMDGYNFDTGQTGSGADAMDLDYYDLYAAAGVSDFYIRNFPQFDKVLYGSNTAKSWYNSLQFGIRKTAASYQARFYYTYSDSKDTISSSGDSYQSPSNSFNPDSNKAPSDFDRKHVMNVALDYAIPFGKNPDSDSEASPWIDRIFGGWNIGVLYIGESGKRFSVLSGRETQYADVPSLASYERYPPDGTIYRKDGIIYWFNPDQADLFTHPVSGKTAIPGRNSFEGPGYHNLDAALHKKFNWGESKYVQFRLEGYNLLNHTRFGLPVDTWTAVALGRSDRRKALRARFKWRCSWDSEESRERIRQAKRGKTSRAPSGFWHPLRHAGMKFLEHLGMRFHIDPAGIAEPVRKPNETPPAYAIRVARLKAKEAARKHESGRDSQRRHDCCARRPHFAET